MRWTLHAETIKRLPKWLYKLGCQLWMDRDFPRHIFIELTSRCNLHCSYCPRPEISRDISFDVFRKVVDETSQYGKRSFSLHLFGEPLLYPKIIEAIRYIKQRGHSVLLTTNGILLSKFYKDLKEVDKIIWSYKENIKVPEELKSWKNFTVRFFEKEYESWPRKEIKSFHNYGGSLESIVRNMEHSRYPCYHPFLAPAVRANGDIVICCADPDGKSVVGNINSMTMKKAWQKMEKVRQEHLNGIFKGVCAKCNTWQVYPNMFFC